MPTYDYICNSCGHEFELFQSMTAPVKRKCPECGKLKLERLIGIGAAVIFKGSGFYETDYRSDSYKKSAEADKKESSGSKDKSKDNDSKKKSETTDKPKPKSDSDSSSKPTKKKSDKKGDSKSSS